MSLSDFTILNKIGQGSYSSVHRVKRISDSKEYALKKVRLLTLKDKQKQNSLNQVRILASISSQYIISYKDAFIDQTTNSLCIIMEYANGGDLQKKIEIFKKNNALFEERQIWRMAHNLINGLKVLHDMKILHRDLKSANIFISDKIYKLGDLNVSKILKKGLAYTQTGTPYYASPQVWRDQPYDSKSDIWSLGCVIYEACALKPPFSAKNMEGLYKKVQKGVFDRIPVKFSDQLQRFIQQCLQLNYFKRPSCDQLLNYEKLLQLNNQNIEIGANNNLMDTIKIPRNLLNLKELLPKSKYEQDQFNKKYQDRIPSRKSEANYIRKQFSLKNLMKKNVSQKNLFPQIKKNSEPPPIAVITQKYNEYYVMGIDKKNNIDSKLKQKQRQRKLIQDQRKFKEKIQRQKLFSKQSERLKQRILSRQKNLMGQPNIYESHKNLYSINALGKDSLQRNIIKLPALQPLISSPNSGVSYLDKGIGYQYCRPSWWG